MFRRGQRITQEGAHSPTGSEPELKETQRHVRLSGVELAANERSLRARRSAGAGGHAQSCASGRAADVDELGLVREPRPPPEPRRAPAEIVIFCEQVHLLVEAA